ncbi:hypothetical protein N7G274_010931 [Stereocaulon virgatum]|uniref:Uncharacterized protein n=1 Tax=Stereocaulon virgatum TaxID=373712 RepID=A0ABR3ZSN0_9LECA
MMPSTTSPTTAQILLTVTYGCTATAIGIVTIHQSRKSYKMWQAHHNRQANDEAADVELGQDVNPPTAITPANSEDAVGVSLNAPIEDHMGTTASDRAEDEACTAVTASHPLAASPTQQASLPTQSSNETIAREAYLSPSLGCGTGSDDSPSAPKQPVDDPTITPGPDQHNDDNAAIR